MPVKLILSERRVLFLKECLKCTGLIRMFACLDCDCDDFVHKCFAYDVHCGMTRDCIKSSYRNVFFEMLRKDGLI